MKCVCMTVLILKKDRVGLGLTESAVYGNVLVCKQRKTRFAPTHHEAAAAAAVLVNRRHVTVSSAAHHGRPLQVPSSEATSYRASAMIGAMKRYPLAVG